MLKFIDRLLHPPKPPLTVVIATSLEKSHYELEEHRHAAEFHQAMIGLYENRIQRLTTETKATTA